MLRITTKQVDGVAWNITRLVAFIPLLVVFITGVLIIRPLGMIAESVRAAFLDGWKS